MTRSRKNQRAHKERCGLSKERENKEKGKKERKERTPRKKARICSQFLSTSAGRGVFGIVVHQETPRRQSERKPTAGTYCELNAVEKNIGSNSQGTKVRGRARSKTGLQGPALKVCSKGEDGAKLEER